MDLQTFHLILIIIKINLSNSLIQFNLKNNNLRKLRLFYINFFLKIFILKISGIFQCEVAKTPAYLIVHCSAARQCYHPL